MTDDDWKKLESRMSMPWGSENLTCDGIKLTLQTKRLGSMRYAIQIYVDGVFKGIWSAAKTPCEEQRRFMRRTERALHRPSDLAKLKRVMSAKQYKEAAAKRWVYFHGYWPSFAPLRRHLVKNNQVIVWEQPKTAEALSNTFAAQVAP